MLIKQEFKNQFPLAGNVQILWYILQINQKEMSGQSCVIDRHPSLLKDQWGQIGLSSESNLPAKIWPFDLK